MKRRQKQLVRILAIVLAILLAGGAIISAVISLAYAEELPAAENRCDFEIEYMNDEQALRITQRLVYTNTSDDELDRVIFYAAPNRFRRLSAAASEADELASLFPDGYFPGGIDLQSVLVNGEDTDWGFQGENELYLRVACDLASGDECEFTFDYYLLLTANRASAGVSDLDVRLYDFCFLPAAYDAVNADFTLNAPLDFTEWIDTPAADYDAALTIPDICVPAASGEETLVSTENHRSTWRIHAEDARDFCICFGSRYRQSEAETDSGIRLRCLCNARGLSDRILSVAAKAVEDCVAWFGPFPYTQFDIVESGCLRGCLAFSGGVWLSEDLFSKKNEAELLHRLRFAVAKQYFGKKTRPLPVSDAWLSDSVSEYIAYLLLEESDGNEAYLSAINSRLVDSLQLTIPGGLSVTSSASLFTQEEYEIVVLNRGAAVFHELRTAMGRDDLIEGLRLFYEKGPEIDALGEMDLVNALDAADGKNWESFLTDWIFNIGEYVNQEIDWLD